MKKRNDGILKLISTFRINMDNIQKWINEVSFFHNDLSDNCSSLSEDIDEKLKALLSIPDNEERIKFISDTLNSILQDNQKYHQLKSKLKKLWEDIKNTHDFPSNVIDDIFKDEKIISPNDNRITEQAKNEAKEKIIQECSPFQNDIDSITEIFEDQFHTMANHLQNMKSKVKSNPTTSKKKTPIFNHVLNHFAPYISVLNLYVLINNQQKFLSKFEDEFDKISKDEAQENAPPPPNEPLNIGDESFLPQTINQTQHCLPSFFNDDFSLNLFPRNEIENRNHFRNPNHSSLFNISRSPINNARGSNTEADNLKKIIEQLQKENQDLKNQNKKLEDQNKDLKSQIDDYQETVEFNDEFIQEVSEGNEELQTEVEDLKNENQKLRKLLEDNNIEIDLS